MNGEHCHLITQLNMSKKVVLVTGASRGIGLAVAEELLKCGNVVYGLGRSKLATLPKVASLQASFQQNFFYESADICSSNDSDKVVKNLLDRFGRLDAIVHNAGVLDPIVRIADIATDSSSYEGYRKLFDVNFFSVAQLTSRCMEELRKTRGHLVFVSSGAATHAYKGWSAYCTSKAALNMLCECVALEEPDVFTVAIRPGVVDTDMQAVIRNDGLKGMGKEAHSQFIDFQKNARLLPPEKPAKVIAKLAVDRNIKRDELNGKFFSWDDNVFT